MTPTSICLVWEMKLDGRLPKGKHEDHAPHDWWYTSWGGGHQMDSYDPIKDAHEKNVKKWRCPGSVEWQQRERAKTPWRNIDLRGANAAEGIGHVIWFLSESGFPSAAGAVEREFGVTT